MDVHGKYAIEKERMRILRAWKDRDGESLLYYVDHDAKALLVACVSLFLFSRGQNAVLPWCAHHGTGALVLPTG